MTTAAARSRLTDYFSLSRAWKSRLSSNFDAASAVSTLTNTPSGVYLNGYLRSCQRAWKHNHDMQGKRIRESVNKIPSGLHRTSMATHQHLFQVLLPLPQPIVLLFLNISDHLPRTIANKLQVSQPNNTLILSRYSNGQQHLVRPLRVSQCLSRARSHWNTAVAKFDLSRRECSRESYHLSKAVLAPVSHDVTIQYVYCQR